MNPAASGLPAGRALTTRYLDFWMLGGASILIWLVMFGLQGFRADHWAIDHHFRNIFAITTTLALIANHPHFMASYKLAYVNGGWPFVVRHWFQLILVPVLLVCLFLCSYVSFTMPTQAHPLVTSVNGLCEALGMRTRIGNSENMGAELLSYGVVFMFMTVGWHYAKQVYGCMMVYANYDQYPLDPLQRAALRWNLYGIWWTNFFAAFSTEGFGSYFGLKYYYLALPRALVTLSWAYLGVTFAVASYRVFYRNYKEKGRLPSLNMLVPYVSLHLWWLPVFYQAEFYLLVPLFHAIQYLVFVYKIEANKLREERPQSMQWRGTLIALGLVLAGYCSFEYFPNTIDVMMRNRVVLNTWFVFICAQIFINVHHYFIDNVLWRFNNQDVKRYLLA